MSGNVFNVDESSYDREVALSDVPVLIDFWAPWCGPCMALSPAIEALGDLYEGKLKVVKINADENVGLMERFGVRGIPAMFLVKGGEVVAPLKQRTRTRLAMELDGLLG